jgi:hypothetical protein
MTKLLSLLFGEPSSTRDGKRRITLLVLLRALASHLFINPIGTIGIVLLFRYRTIQSVFLIPSGFAFSLISSVAYNTNECRRLRKRVRLAMTVDFRFCSFRRLSILDQLPAATLEELFAYFEERLGPFFSKIYRHTMESVQIFEYDASEEAYQAARLEGHKLRMPDGPVAYVDNHGYTYILVPKTRKPNVLSRFVIIHELGHAITLAAVPRMRGVFDPHALLLLICFIPFLLKWSVLGGLLYLTLFLLFLDHFTPREHYLAQHGVLGSESIADEFAVEQLTDQERGWLLKRWSRISYADASKESHFDQVRRWRLLQLLRGFDVNYDEVAMLSTLEPLWKLVLLIALSCLCVPPNWLLVNCCTILTLVSLAAVLFLNRNLQVQDHVIASRVESVETPKPDAAID